ncbi:GCN5-related N-acetyltransferase [mine drainage metagenome]|uniref:GCN5-related N-acetyltransferase n=1 Tax=mine drainage metagenome TaxID=410659 RepID=T0ZES3_9ZZZZ
MSFEWILVDGLHKRHQIGSRVTRFAERQAKRMGARKVWSDSRASNYQALGLEKGMRFRRIGTLKRHWFGQDYILWEKEL